jgi:hypothetical protein
MMIYIIHCISLIFVIYIFNILDYDFRNKRFKWSKIIIKKQQPYKLKQPYELNQNYFSNPLGYRKVNYQTLAKLKNGKEKVINKVCIVSNEIANKYETENPKIIDFSKEFSLKLKQLKNKEFIIDFSFHHILVFILSVLIFTLINIVVVIPFTNIILASLINGIYISFILAKYIRYN